MRLKTKNTFFHYGLTMGFALLLSSLMAVTVQAGMYKYVDEDGNVTYSQTPPSTGDYKSIKLPKEATRSGLSKEERDAARQKSRDAIMGKTIDGDDTDSEAKADGGDPSKKEEKLVKDETKKNKDERSRLCKQARESKTNLEIYRRFKDKDGNVVRYSDEERAKRLKNANEAIKQFCS